MAELIVATVAHIIDEMRLFPAFLGWGLYYKLPWHRISHWKHWLFPTISERSGWRFRGQRVLKRHILAGDYSTKGPEAFAVYENCNVFSQSVMVTFLLISLHLPVLLLQDITCQLCAREMGQVFCSRWRREVPVDTPSSAAPLSTMGGRRSHNQWACTRLSLSWWLRLPTHPQRKCSQLKGTSGARTKKDTNKSTFKQITFAASSGFTHTHTLDLNRKAPLPWCPVALVAPVWLFNNNLCPLLAHRQHGINKHQASSRSSSPTFTRGWIWNEGGRPTPISSQHNRHATSLPFSTCTGWWSHTDKTRDKELYISKIYISKNGINPDAYFREWKSETQFLHSLLKV